MTINIKQAVTGSTVYFRNGGKAVVTYNGYKPDDAWPYKIFFDVEGGIDSYSFNETGEFLNGKKHLLDIIRIEPPKFDWKNVKPGMAFHRPLADETMWYIGQSAINPTPITFFETKDDIVRYATHNLSLIPTPEFDKVSK